MPIMIPINIQDVPAIPVFDMSEYMTRVSQYATELWDTMTREERAKFTRRRKMVTDEELEASLADRPDYASVQHDDMSQLTKEDYSRYAAKHHVIKGAEKWL